MDVACQQKFFVFFGLLQLFLSLNMFIVLVINGAIHKELQFLGSAITTFFLMLTCGILSILSKLHFNFPYLKIILFLFSLITTTLCGLFIVIFLSSFIDKNIPAFPIFIFQIVLFFLELSIGISHIAIQLRSTIKNSKAKIISNVVSDL